jgi:hypothetical protein
MRSEDLDRDVAVQPRVLGPIDNAHSARTERLSNGVGT